MEQPQPMDVVESENAFPTAADAKAKGTEHYKKKEYDQAIHCYTIAIDMAPDEAAPCLNNRAAAYMMLNKFELAASDARMALAKEPTNIKYHLRAGRCYLSLWRISDAQRHFSAALEIDPANADAIKENQALQELLRIEKSVEAAFTDKQFNNAISLLERALVQVPGADALRLRQVDAYLRMKNLDQAEQLVTSLLRANRNNVGALYWRGIILQRRGEIESAIKHFQNALVFDPDHEGAARSLKVARQMVKFKTEGGNHFRENRLDEALAAYLKSLELDPANDAWNSVLYFNCAIVRAKKGETEAAIKDCTAAIDLDARYVKALTKRAQLYMLVEKYDEAASDYSTLKDLEPSNREFRTALKNAQLEAKKAKRVDYYKVLEIPKDADEQAIQKAYRKLARTWHPDRHQGDEAKAAADTKFKQVGEAYQVLSDPRKRQAYDSGADLEDGGGGMGGMDPTDLFAHMFRVGGGMGGMPFSFGGGGGRGGFPGGFPGGFGGGFPGGFGGFGGHGHGHDYDDDYE
eukprot:m.87634 g.87634  ORF g.87634 m.87634 type:complete len:520 (-) comp13591_c1_seq1:27-1586(-)